MFKVYPNLEANYMNPQWLCERAILAPRNDSVSIINLKLLAKIPCQEQSYKSLDTVVVMYQAVQYPTEFLKSLEPPGMPPHNLLLKDVAPIMLLRNLDPPKPCNGTRLTVKRLMPHVLETTIITGSAKGEDVLIPRILLIPTDKPFN